MAAVEFWYEFGSTYTYLTVARIGALAERQGVAVVWRPFLLMPIMRKLGMHEGPFLPYPHKLDYMWRDIERRAAEHGLAYRRPARYPPEEVITSARIAFAAARQGWCRAFTEHVFRLHWTEDRPIGSEDNLRTAIARSGQDADEVLAQAGSPEVKQGLREQTERAQETGLFGSPSFLVGRELFWGDDRLEQALAWAAER